VSMTESVSVEVPPYVEAVIKYPERSSEGGRISGNKEFTFDVDTSKLPCGLNGAVYFSEMDEDGGLSRFSTNKAGIWMVHAAS